MVDQQYRLEELERKVDNLYKYIEVIDDLLSTLDRDLYEFVQAIAGRVGPVALEQKAITYLNKRQYENNRTA